MTDTNNGWLGKPGVPMNPEKDDWHWLRTPDGELVPYNWRPEGECEWGRWASAWIYDKEDDWPPEECTYLGPCLTPDEAITLQARVAELEGQNEMLRHATDKLRAMLKKLNSKHEPLQRAFVTAVELLNDAALERKTND